MDIIGIICEFNPLHNGHIYFLKQIKEKYTDSLIILCLNGYFLQRGEISILSKEDKTQLALLNGIDLVVELPVLYGTQSSDIFALNACTLLQSMGCKKIIFGSETNDLDYLMSIAKKQENLNNLKLRENLKQGNNYPKSLISSLNESKILPNDLLGISYCKAILKLKSSMLLETIKRTSDYHDTSSNEKIISASNIRQKLINNIAISPYVPKEIEAKIKTINTNLYFQLLKHSILTTNNLNQYLDVTEGLENLLYKKIKDSQTFDEFFKKIKSKRYTTNRLNRMLIHILLGIQKKDTLQSISYIHILGFNNKGKKYLKDNKNITLPLKPNRSSLIYKLELKSAIIYDLLTNSSSYEFERKNKPIYINTDLVFKESNQK